MPGHFLDTNILVYAFTDDARAEEALRLLAQGCTISIQGLNEFANVARRNLRMDWAELHSALAALRSLCRDIRPLDIDTHADAVKLAEPHGFSFFDALIVAAALRAQCDILWSEDLQHGMLIEGRLKIANPFL